METSPSTQTPFTVPGTTVTHGDLILLGTYLLNWCAASHLMGHAHPQSSTMYIAAPDDWCGGFVHAVMNAAADTARGDRSARLSEPWQAVQDKLWETGWMRHVTDNVDRPVDSGSD